ncbi:MAG: 4'-phosphopantetheinyl transferase superfamily protein [Clostridiaceae bacterium]|nr:4'-phosphopantetheinyl transferase superfamily protein [Clostridiaceae bacterium]
MTAVYAIPVSAVNPDDSASRARLSRGRLEQIDRRRGTARSQGFAASLLLEYAVAQHYPSIVHPLSISIAEGGKPYLINEPNVHFSLSHSAGWAVCALSDHPVGVDIERCEPGRRDVAARFFHKDEVRYLNSLLPSMRDDAFYKLWTLKESFVKSTGRGLDLPLRSFRIDIHRMPPRLECDEVPGAYSLFLPEFTDREYRLAVCIEQADALEPVLNILD